MLNEFQKRVISITTSVAQWMQDRLNTSRGKIIGEESYWYTHTLLNVPLGTTLATAVQAQIPIQGDADFDCYYLSACGVQASAVVSTPYVLMQITDTGTGRTLFSEPALVSLVTGLQGSPYILQNVRQFKMKSNIQITYFNPGATDTLMQTVFGGIKVKYDKS